MHSKTQEETMNIKRQHKKREIWHLTVRRVWNNSIWKFKKLKYDIRKWVRSGKKKRSGRPQNWPDRLHKGVIKLPEIKTQWLK